MGGLVLARDLGDGPHKAFGSALRPKYSAPLDTPGLVGLTMKPRFMGACAHCGEKLYFCHHIAGDEA